MTLKRLNNNHPVVMSKCAQIENLITRLSTSGLRRQSC